MDVFVQSWNPEISQEMDAYWSPARSLHAAQNTSCPVERCPVRHPYCERTMWALLGMKRALEMRRDWAAGPAGQVSHSSVITMRHDVYWFNQLPMVRADRAIRLWLPLDCTRRACQMRSAAGGDQRCDVTRHRHSTGSSNWTLVTAPTQVLGRSCAGAAGYAWCEHSINTDFWWIADSAVADAFPQTYDRFGAYTLQIKNQLRWYSSAPHHYWGLFFFHTLRLRAMCQLGYVAQAYADFTLGRLFTGDRPADACGLHGYRALWKPPRTHGLSLQAAWPLLTGFMSSL